MRKFQSLFYWITYSYKWQEAGDRMFSMFQSLFYWITYSYGDKDYFFWEPEHVSILILLDYLFLQEEFIMNKNSKRSFNPYFTGLPILIFYRRYRYTNWLCSFNPYFTGLPILIHKYSSIIIYTINFSIIILLDYLFLYLEIAF